MWKGEKERERGEVEGEEGRRELNVMVRRGRGGEENKGRHSG